ncbi:hypothetical protein GPA19_13300 [Azoarcus indigens]|uniref:PhnA-like protein n=1 Tax=Azoarcus indigens TaxID=29545 RepID=A0A4R6EF80_9RHOO|nr:hypothetical protein [Azoarcus indigens]NMG65922.1 hypothetical protein [Azoarcus indigens]TDN55928.1 hypothetical protein C7389_103266 [Azoarcus indigens]
METRTIEATTVESSPLINGIHWSAIFAGLAVGLGVHLLLMLAGIAAGFAVYGAGARPDGGSVSVAAAVWNTLSMLISAFVGGYVAARSSGLRRSSDGMLHGVVSWGATMLFFAVITGSLTGNAVTGMFGMAASTSTAAVAQADDSTVGELFASLERGDRASAVNLLRDRLGLSEEQAGRAADQAMAMMGRTSAGAQPGTVNDAAQAASIASTWLSVAILLSLMAGAAGGTVGARSARMRAMPGRYGERRVVRTRSTAHRVPTAT